MDARMNLDRVGYFRPRTRLIRRSVIALNRKQMVMSCFIDVLSPLGRNPAPMQCSFCI
jgi:hypothetical protein